MRNTYKGLFAALIISLFIMQPASSYADWNGHNSSHDSGNGHNGNGHDGHDHDRGHSYIGVNLSIWPDSYFYGSPYYPTADEVLVSPPVYQPVVINGATYYLNNGTYYAYNGYGYQPVTPPVTVVEPPITVVQPPVVVDNQAQSAGPVITAAGTTSDPSDSFTINIPNKKGGYTAVTLKRSGNGYIGPQGEFYPEFPKVYQLEVIYGK